MKAKLTIVVFFLVLFSSNSFAVPLRVPNWRTVQHPQSLPIYGGVPLSVEEVLVTQEIIKNNKAYYTYKLIIRRPSGDNGWGIAYLNPLKYRLHYWAATTGTNPMMSIHKSTGVYQHTHENPHKVVVHLQKGLPPGKYVISVAIFPYPMYGDYSFKDFIQFWRGPYVSFLYNLKDALATTHPAAAAAVFVESYVVDEVVNGTLIRLANRYGQRLELEVLAKMPRIKTGYAKRAIRLLKMRNLVPAPDYSHPIITNDKRFHNRVAKCRFEYGVWLKAKTKVPYKFYKYVKKGGNKPNKPNKPNNNATYFVCNKDSAEGCCCFKGFHTYNFSKRFVKRIKVRFDTGKGLKCKSRVDIYVRTTGGWNHMKSEYAISGKNGTSANKITVEVPINHSIIAVRIGDGCTHESKCCIEWSEMYLY